jgi:AraC family transcriptional regulator of adaptative response/methylated-DNA-[protein]-cysteine methyltransferase
MISIMTDYERIEKVIKYLESNFKAQPSLGELAVVAGVSEFHFHRLFKRWAGTTPKSFLQFLTANHAKKMLMESRDLLSTSLESGLSGPGRLHDLLISIEAVTPGEYKAQGANVEINYGVHDSPFGKCLIGTTKRGICHLAFIDTNIKNSIKEMKENWPKASFKSAPLETKKIFSKIFKRSGSKKISLVLYGTPFQVKVWEALLRIPEGNILSYGDLAKLTGSPGASRAVGSALAKNAIAYLIPCHRVIRETGDFGEYHWGSARKAALLSWETISS